MRNKKRTAVLVFMTLLFCLNVFCLSRACAYEDVMLSSDADFVLAAADVSDGTAPANADDDCCALCCVCSCFGHCSFIIETTAPTLSFPRVVAYFSDEQRNFSSADIASLLKPPCSSLFV